MNLQNGGAALAVLDAGGQGAVALTDNLEKFTHAARGAYSENYRRAIRHDTGLWSAWCAEHGRQSRPASPETIAAFIDDQAAIKKPGTVRRYVASISFMCRAAGVEPNPCASNIVKLALRRMHVEKGRRQDQAAGVTIELRNRMLAAAPDTLLGKRNRAVLAVAYDTMLRRSELIALDLADLSPATVAVPATVLVRRSKTDAEGQGAFAYLSPDTMATLAAWLAASGTDRGALFRSVGKAGRVGGRLDSGDVSRIFKRMARAAALAPELVEKISGHSTRVGACQDMTSAGVELGLIMGAGRWKTAGMVARYSEHLAARRGGAAKLAAIQGRA